MILPQKRSPTMPQKLRFEFIASLTKI